MGTKHIRHLVTELAARLSDRDFLRKAGISRRTMQEIFVRDKWEEALESLFPIRERLSCKQILELCHPELWALSGEPEEGWISFTYKFSTHILYPDPEFSEKAASYARGAYVYLNVLQFFFDEERKAVPFDPFNDFALLGEEEYQSCDRAGEYGRFVREFRDQYIYEMMRLNREATPFETLSHIAGVHHVAMTVARGLKKAGVPIDLALSSGAAAGHDLGKFGCKPNERVPYLHYYYTNQWFMAYKMEGIGHIAANHSTWDLELDNITVESLVLIYADFRVKQMRDAPHLTAFPGMAEFFRLFLYLFHRDHDIPQHQLSRIRIEILLRRLLQPVKISRCLKVAHGKRKYVCGTVDAPHVQVDLMDPLIVRQDHVYLRVVRALYVVQGFLHHISDDLLIRNFQPLFSLILDGYCHFFRPFRPGGPAFLRLCRGPHIHHMLLRSSVPADGAPRRRW